MKRPQHKRWLVQDLYLRTSWPVARSPSIKHTGFDKRRFWLGIMLAFAVLDAILAVVFYGDRFGISLANSPQAARTPGRVIAGDAAVATAGAKELEGIAAARTPQQAALARTAAARVTRVAPTATPQPEGQNNPVAPTRPPPVAAAPRPTQPAPTLVSLAVPAPPKAVAPARTFSVPLAGSLGLSPLTIGVPPEPPDCTPAANMPDVVTTPVKLCPNQTYRPFTLQGNGIGVFGDPGKTAVIQVSGRRYGIVAEGSNLFLRDVVIRAATAPSDINTYLCLYPDCRGNPGGAAYGGGILVRAPNTTIMNSVISGGVAGVAAQNLSGLKLLSNQLNGSTGWGSYNLNVNDSYFIGNSLSDNNRSCVTPDGHYLPTGCESAGWLCVSCQRNIVAQNTCTNSGDCYYINGEGNLQSNQNRFHGNQCRASPHNCFEVTFSLGNEFVENTAEADPATGAMCKYPFWVGGSSVVFMRNQWKCSIGPDIAIQHATNSTTVPTRVEWR